MSLAADIAPSAPPPFILRRAGPADAGLLSSIKIACWRESYAGHLPKALLAGLEKHPWHSPSAWRSLLHADGLQRLTYIVEMPRPMGLLRFGPYDGSLEGPRGMVDAIYLRRSIQGMGIGTKLLGVARGWLRGAGLAPVAIGAFTFNERALTLYRRLGAVPLGRERAFTFEHRDFEETILVWPA
jgi:GNAT superfamily N-acetyltransferase